MVGSPTRVLLDTDLAMGTTGSDIDDGFALALAVAEPDVSLELVTTVAGNTDVDTATRLSTELLVELGHPEVPVVAGAAGPLGAAGRSSAAAAELARRVTAEPGELTIVAIGPLTNLALALQLEPQLAEAVREVVVMGGAYLGDERPAEFNFSSDPDAAGEVLDSGCRLRLVGLDVTRQVRLSRDDAADLAATGGAFAARAAKATEGWIDFLERERPHEAPDGSCALHDPLAMAVVTRPDLVAWRSARVEVERRSADTRGMATADLLAGVDPPAPDAEVAVAVDHRRFRELFLRRMAELP